VKAEGVDRSVNSDGADPPRSHAQLQLLRLRSLCLRQTQCTAGIIDVVVPPDEYDTVVRLPARYPQTQL
jgi:hypothetical protein